MRIHPDHDKLASLVGGHDQRDLQMAQQGDEVLRILIADFALGGLGSTRARLGAWFVQLRHEAPLPTVGLASLLNRPHPAAWLQYVDGVMTDPDLTVQQRSVHRDEGSCSVNKLKVGDVVRLASGGPKMTVTGDSDEPGQVLVEWFDEDNDTHSREFPEEALVKDDSRPQ